MRIERRLICYLWAIATSYLASAQEKLTLEDQVIKMQKEIVARLSGEQAIKDDLFLSQRSNTKEKRVAADYLSQRLIEMGWTVTNHHYRTVNSNMFLDLFFNPAKGTNVSAVLPSTIKSDEYIIFGGHYDSERGSPGAIDNATGVALCMGLVKKLSGLAFRGKNLIVVFFDQEEDDEVGSAAYVQMLQKKKVGVHSVHITDMMGWDSDKNRQVTFQSSSKTLTEVYRQLADDYSIPYKVIGGGASDNRSFEAAGYNTVAIFEDFNDTTPYIHLPGDTYDTVDFDYLASSTQLIFQALKGLLK